MHNIVLASTSPYRRAILEKLGLPFSTQSPHVDETRLTNETASSMVARLSQLKAEAVASTTAPSLIIGSDQCAVINEEIIGKPETHDRAVQQLRQASGRCVTFFTGLCLINTATHHIHLEVVPFMVHFRILSADQIENYLRKDQPYNCAGSFKSEGLGISLFERLEGDDPNTLMGLPLIRLIRMLEHEGVRVI